MPRGSRHGRPTIPYEKLFVGKALFWLDYQQSIDYLSEAVQQTPSPLSFLLRARSSALLASSLRTNKDSERSLDERNECLRLIEQAIQDIQVANYLLKARNPDSEERFSSPEIEVANLLVLLHVYEIYTQLELMDDASRVLRKSSLLELKGKNNYLTETLYYLLDPDSISGLEHAKHLLDPVDDEVNALEALGICQSYTVQGNLETCRERSSSG